MLSDVQYNYIVTVLNIQLYNWIFSIKETRIKVRWVSGLK
jgi:hypothetical protein